MSNEKFHKLVKFFYCYILNIFLTNIAISIYHMWIDIDNLLRSPASSISFKSIRIITNTSISVSRLFR